MLQPHSQETQVKESLFTMELDTGFMIVFFRNVDILMSQ